MNINPKYISFQWQTYTKYTWSIENAELRNIPNVLDWTLSIVMMLVWIWFFLLALLMLPTHKKDLQNNTNTDDTTK